MPHPWETDSDAEKRRVQAAALEAAANGIVITDNAGTIEWVNLAFSRFTGYTREEIIGKHTRILKSGKQDPAFYKALWETITAGGDWHGELVNRRKDGSTYIEEMTITPVRDELGEIRHFISIRQDITERREIENGLEKARKELAAIKISEDEARDYSESIINTVREPLIALDQDLRVVSVSRSFYEVFKVNPQETLGQLIYDLGNKQWNIPKLRELLETILPQKATFDNYEVEHDFATIGRRIMLLNARQIQRVLGKERIILLAIEDITGRKDIEAALQKASAELQVKYHDIEIASSQVTAVINAANEAMILLSPDDRFLWLNRAFGQLFSMKPKDIIGHSFSEFAPRFQQFFEDPDSIKAHLEKAIRDKDLQYKETAVQNWPQKRELEMYSTPVRTSLREHVGTLFVFRDVTHEREVERMKSEFVSLVSHELRTPLTSIKGYVDMLMDGDAGELKQDQVDFLQVVSKNAERLVTLVTDLLDVSKIEAGAMRLNLAPLDLAGVISEVVANLRPLNESKKQNVNINLPEKMPPLTGDTGRIAQVLTNLVSNACRYTPSGGTIRVDVRPEVEFVKISVTDTGIGISPEEQKKLFTKFFRAENPDVQKVGGTGLGLWIARSLVLMHGGEITVASLPGKGSTFTFTLPIDQGS
jgi:PAS domain S-box-containing protein